MRFKKFTKTFCAVLWGVSVAHIAYAKTPDSSLLKPNSIISAQKSLQRILENCSYLYAAGNWIHARCYHNELKLIQAEFSGSHAEKSIQAIAEISAQCPKLDLTEEMSVQFYDRNCLERPQKAFLFLTEKASNKPPLSNNMENMDELTRALNEMIAQSNRPLNHAIAFSSATKLLPPPEDNTASSQSTAVSLDP